jgi:hypothetical protein
MAGRAQRSPQERQARSRAVQRLAEESLLRGSLVQMARGCGKKGCHCAQGEKHVSLYLAVRQGQQRRLIYLPVELEATARAWVQNARELDAALDFISQECLQDFLSQKEQALGRPVPKRPARSRRKPR